MLFLFEATREKVSILFHSSIGSMGPLCAAQFAGLTLMRNNVIALLSSCKCRCVYVCVRVSVCSLNPFVQIVFQQGINCHYDYDKVFQIGG